MNMMLSVFKVLKKLCIDLLQVFKKSVNCAKPFQVVLFAKKVFQFVFHFSNIFPEWFLPQTACSLKQRQRFHRRLQTKRARAYTSLMDHMNHHRSSSHDHVVHSVLQDVFETVRNAVGFVSNKRLVVLRRHFSCRAWQSYILPGDWARRIQQVL